MVVPLPHLLLRYLLLLSLFLVFKGILTSLHNFFTLCFLSCHFHINTLFCFFFFLRLLDFLHPSYSCSFHLFRRFLPIYPLLSYPISFLFLSIHLPFCIPSIHLLSIFFLFFSQFIIFFHPLSSPSLPIHLSSCIPSKFTLLQSFFFSSFIHPVFFSTFYPIHPDLYIYLRLIILFILNHQPSIHSLNLSIPIYHPPFLPPDLSNPTHIITFDTLTLPLLSIILPFSPCTTHPYPSTSLPPPSLSPLFTHLFSTLYPFQPLPSYRSSSPCPFQTIHLPPRRGLV